MNLLKTVFSFALICFLFNMACGPLLAQTPGAPAAREDVAIERQKVLRAADQLDLMTEEIQRIKQELADLKKRMIDLSVENQNLRNRLTESEAQRLKERQRPPVSKQPVSQKSPTLTPATSAVQPPATAQAHPAVVATTNPAASATAPAAQANVSSNLEKGYEHIVAPGQTLWTIAKAYRQHGVKVSVEKIRKANNLKSTDSIRVGQKLFIPAQ